jgi:hypothetical protein
MLHFGLVAGLTSLVVAGLAALVARGRPKAWRAGSGTISPERWTAALTVLFGLAMASGGTIALVAGDWKVGSGLLLIGLACAVFMCPSLTDLHNVSWSSEGVEGPSRLFGPTLGFRRTSIAWSEIESAGKTITGYWYVQTADHRRVYWSYLYKGYAALTASLINHRPDVVLPSDL